MNSLIMNAKEFRKMLIQVTLKSVDKKPEEWLTFNDQLNTKIIIGEPENIRLEKDLELEELPVLECKLADSYLLVTTQRIISILGDHYDEVRIENIEKFLNDYEQFNYKKVDGKYPKTHKIAIKKGDGNHFLFVIDSFYPSFFVKILISNLVKYKKNGTWFLNPNLS